MSVSQVLKIPQQDKDRLKILFLAKHALFEGQFHSDDGNHAVYHHEILTALRTIGLQVTPADDFPAIFENPESDYLFTLLNRAGFPMSEMLGPLMACRVEMPYLGASPIIRGLGDDKHLMKTVVARCGIPVTPWQVVRQGSGKVKRPDFAWDQIVVKPNASSASWGVGIFSDWAEAEEHCESLLKQGNDVIIEDFFGDYDVAQPVVGGRKPWNLPLCRFIMPGTDDDSFRSYDEKRGRSTVKEKLIQVETPEIVDQVSAAIDKILPEIWPFDYGRLEFRYDEKTNQIRFMEVNLSCNLWSKKTVAGAAKMINIDHLTLIEHIVAYSMERQGLIMAESV